MYRTTALIPSYCPTETLIQLVKELNECNVQCVCVNDGSREEFNQIFEKLPEGTILLKHETNRGKGAALKTGMKYIFENMDYDIVVTCDSDGQHLCADILRCAREASMNQNCLVLGVRDFAREDVPFRSRYGNQLTEKIFAFSTGVRIKDTQTGLRAFHVSLIPEFLEIKGDRYEYEMNQLLVCARKGIQMIQIPIETVYEGNNEGSHFHVIRDSVRIYSEILKFSLSSLASFVLDTALFAVLNMLFSFSGGMAAANILARICSASFNYEVNRSAVFRDSSKRSSSFLRYVMLAGVILILNTCLLYGLNAAGLSALPAKIMTEMILFIFSYIAQNRYVFNHSQRKAEI